MVARSYDEALARRAVEATEQFFDELEAALWQLAQLVTKDGGEVYMPAYQRVQEEYDATKERMAIIAQAREIASQPPPKGLKKRSSKARRAVV